MSSAIEHIVVLMLENRSFDHMLGWLYADAGNKSPLGHPFEGLTGTEANPDSSGRQVPVFRITAATPNAYFMPGADPGEGYKATNSQLFGRAAERPAPGLRRLGRRAADPCGLSGDAAKPSVGQVAADHHL